MNRQKATELLQKLETDRLAQNFIAQANSRYILFNVNEPIENFPRFTPGLNERLMSIALSYLSIGCSFAENGDLKQGTMPFEKGANILEYVHSPEQNRTEYSIYYILVSSLAYYAAFQYSKSFILLKYIEFETEIARLIGYFLKRDYQNLISLLNKILISDEYSDAEISEIEDEREANAKIYTVLLTKSLSTLLEYVYSGEQTWLHSTRETLDDLLELLSLDEEPSMWWVIRILRIIVDGFYHASLWNTISPNLGSDDCEPVDRFILGLTFRKPPVVELFLSQRVALPKILAPSGAVVSLPTSSGKTRIAEIAILQTLIAHPESLVLYLAPFRSLAFEIEGSLERTFHPLEFEVSHLYGGSQFSKIDKTLIETSNIIIATPEKAKAILRADPVIVARIKLAIIDEGHLLGATQRDIANELFIEELKFYIEKNEGKIILLSAVLPNVKEFSKWIAKDEESTVESDWRPSSQRFGTLEWTGDNINIEWIGERRTYNYNFVERVQFSGKEQIFPSNKKQGIAAAALKFSHLGPVLIFVGKKNMVNSQAKEVLCAMGEKPEPHNWTNKYDWESFELACEESYGNESDILQYATYGILCHNANLSAEVKYCLERLMRNGNPNVIISTTTLAQGVNIGVSSVIIANVWIGKKQHIDNKDFWNIAGRAGRAFIDGEGKILFAIDNTKEQWQISRDRKLAFTYFEFKSLEKTKSGLLQLIKRIIEIANTCNISFDLLMQLIAENDCTKYVTKGGASYSQAIEDTFDCIDDTLLALNVEHKSHELEDSSAWIDDYFRKSLAYIQAENDAYFDENHVISFLKARNSGIIKLAGEPQKWRSFVATGIPLRSSITIEQRLEEILALLSEYHETSQTEEDLISFLQKIEAIITEFPSKVFKCNYPESELNEIRKLWITGKPLNEINNKFQNGPKVCNQYFAFTLPWAINAIAKKLSTLELEDEAKAFEEVAVQCELGLPNLFAVKIYLTGIKSRVAATELSKILNPELIEKSVKELRDVIIEKMERIQKMCSETTAKWIKILVNSQPSYITEVEKISNFNFKEHVDVEGKTLQVRKFDNAYYLCTPNYESKIRVDISENFPFDKFANNPGIYFEYDEDFEVWQMKVRNPFLKLNDPISLMFSDR